ncbi:hypothetical protein [Azospirillum brasilense]|uniref:hypothetical protein n=1 Tax=Azospirillum brasilense TaxID=192 RepID=UPI0018CA6872|nr:hypothetical protein [Azospirillum brasilense]
MRNQQHRPPAGHHHRFDLQPADERRMAGQRLAEDEKVRVAGVQGQSPVDRRVIALADPPFRHAPLPVEQGVHPGDRALGLLLRGPVQRLGHELRNAAVDGHGNARPNVEHEAGQVRRVLLRQTHGRFDPCRAGRAIIELNENFPVGHGRVSWSCEGAFPPDEHRGTALARMRIATLTWIKTGTWIMTGAARTPGPSRRSSAPNAVHGSST